MEDLEFKEFLLLCGRLSNKQAKHVKVEINIMLNDRNEAALNLSTVFANWLNQNDIYTKQEVMDTFNRPGGAKFYGIGKKGMNEINSWINQKEG